MGTTWRIARWVLLLVFGTYFLIPLLALLNFSTKNTQTQERSGEAWTALAQDPAMTDAIITSLLLAGFTVVGMVVLLVPTMIWVRLRVPKATRLIEFLCLLPLTIPALVIVVGMKNVYAWVNYLIGDSALTLTFVYIVLVLPYSYRAIDAALGALDAKTLAEAARSLGASWFTVITRVILPNIWPGVLGAAFIAVALVLGEFTIASLAHYNTLPVVIVFISKANAPEAMAAALASLMVAALLLLMLSFLDRRRRNPGGI